MRPVRVQVITYAPTIFYHCQHCELTFREMGIGERIRREEASQALPEDLQHQYAEVSGWLHDLAHRFGPRIRVRLVDAASIEGFFKSLVHRTRRYPSVVVDGPHRYIGTDQLRGGEGKAVLRRGGLGIARHDAGEVSR
jgi:hypothetical protein